MLGMKLWDWLVDMCIWHEATLPYEDAGQHIKVEIDGVQYTTAKPLFLGKNEYIESIEIRVRK